MKPETVHTLIVELYHKTLNVCESSREFQHMAVEDRDDFRTWAAALHDVAKSRRVPADLRGMAKYAATSADQFIAGTL